MAGNKDYTKAIHPLSGGQALSEIVKAISDKSYPPVHLWEPEFCGSIDMRIAKDGSWYYMNSPIDRHEMVKLFSTVLRKDGNDYFLVTPVEKLGIIVDDVPFHIISMEKFGEGEKQTLSFTTSTDDKVIAGADNPIRVSIDAKSGEPSPYVMVRGGMEGLMARSVFYELVELAVPSTGDSGEYGVWSGGEFFSIGKIDGADS